MANKLYEESSIIAIANAIREKNGSRDTYKVSEMPSAIESLSGSEPLVEFCQINPIVKAYMENVTYDPSDYTVSSVGQYASQATDYNKYQPSGYDIDVESGTLYVADSNNGTMSENVSDGTKTVYNIVPLTGGIYANVDENGNVVKAGKLLPTGSLRMLHVDGIRNVRDLGGWACDGGTVKYGKIIRGTTMNGSYTITENGINVLKNLIKIDHELDFRDLEEWTGTESALGSDVAYTHIPYSMYNTAISATAWQEAFVKIFRCILDCVLNNEPIYIHCESGMDRCGTVCFLLESILGMSQSDIDKDYELSSFFTYPLASILKERNNQYYVAMVNDIGKYSGNTHRDKTVNYLLTLGISIDEINAFRSAMIDGTPESLSTTVDTYSVTNTLSNVTNDNGNNSVDEYQPYSANISVPSGYVIESVQITMGGIDVTSQVWSGAKTNLNRTVSFSLSGCELSNTKKVVQDGQIYGAFVNAKDGYTLDGATVTIKMGGVDVSTYYENGAIVIPKVTGNLEINISAVSTAAAYTNVAVPNTTNKTDTTKWVNDYRISSSGLSVLAGKSVCNPVESLKKGDVVRVKGVTFVDGVDRYGSWEADGTWFGNGAGYVSNGSTTFVGINIVGDIYEFTVLSDFISTMRFAFTTPTDASKVIITVNEEIV